MPMTVVRRRVSAESVLATASAGSSKITYLRLPKELTLWQPEGAKVYPINFVPYVIESENHPDRKTNAQGVEEYVSGDVWYRHPYKIHARVGPNREDVVCPTSWNNPCPICEFVQELFNEYEANRKAISNTRAKEQSLYLIQNPKDKDELSVFPYSMFKFGDFLDNEIRSTLAENRFFFECGSNGRRVDARLATATHEGRAFLKCERIDFFDRPEIDEEEHFAKGICLDHMFDVKSYEQLRKLFSQAGSSTTAASSTQQSVDPQASTSGTAGGSTSKPKKSKAPAAATDEPAASDERGTGIDQFREGDTVGFNDEKKRWKGVVLAIDHKNDNISIKRSDGKERDKDFTMVDLENEETEATEKAEVAPEKVKAKPKPKPKAPEPEEDAEFKVGMWIKDQDKEIAEITGVDAAGDLEVKGVKGDDRTWLVMKSEATRVEKEEEKTEAASEDSDEALKPGDRVSFTSKISGKAKEYTGVILKIDTSTDDAKIKGDEGGEHRKDISELTKIEDEPEPEPELELKAGMQVSFKDPKTKKTMKGELIKVKDDEPVWKVRKADGEAVWIDTDKLTVI